MKVGFWWVFIVFRSKLCIPPMVPLDTLFTLMPGDIFLRSKASNCCSMNYKYTIGGVYNTLYQELSVWVVTLYRFQVSSKWLLTHKVSHEISTLTSKAFSLIMARQFEFIFVGRHGNGHHQCFDGHNLTVETWYGVEFSLLNLGNCYNDIVVISFAVVMQPTRSA